MHRLFGFGGGGTGDAKSNSPKSRERNISKEDPKDSKLKRKTALIEDAFNGEDLSESVSNSNKTINS